MTKRLISEIARDIGKDWTNPNYAAAPYLDAMYQLGTIEDKFMADDAHTIVLYFLSNASTFRGPIAKVLKAELRSML